jgi:hypothetical protein
MTGWTKYAITKRQMSIANGAVINEKAEPRQLLLLYNS